MDTGDLTDKTYKAIMVEAERFHHDLTLQFGLLSDECDDETSFIKMSAKLIRQMMKYGEDEMDDMFFGHPPDKKEFHKALNKILDNISKLSQ